MSHVYEINPSGSTEPEYQYIPVRPAAGRPAWRVQKRSLESHEKAAGARLSSWEELPKFIEDFGKLNQYYQETGKDDLY